MPGVQGPRGDVGERGPPGQKPRPMGHYFTRFKIKKKLNFLIIFFIK